MTTTLLVALSACAREPAAPLAVRFTCHFEGDERPLRIGLNLATSRGMLAVSDDAFVDVHLVAKDDSLALLPGGLEDELPQVRIQLDGKATLRSKVYPAEQETTFSGSCERS